MWLDLLKKFKLREFLHKTILSALASCNWYITIHAFIIRKMLPLWQHYRYVFLKAHYLKVKDELSRLTHFKLKIK